MISEEVARWVTQAGVATSAVTGTLFVLVYHFRTQWWKSSIGRHMMSFMAGLTLIMALALTAVFVPNLPGRQELRVFTWILLPVLFVWRLVILLRVKHYDDDGNPTK